MDYEKSNQSGIFKLTLDPVLFSWLYVAIVVSAFPLVELSVDALGTQKRKERKSVLVRLQTAFCFLEHTVQFSQVLLQFTFNL